MITLLNEPRWTNMTKWQLCWTLISATQSWQWKKVSILHSPFMHCFPHKDSMFPLICLISNLIQRGPTSDMYLSEKKMTNLRRPTHHFFVKKELPKGRDTAKGRSANLWDLTSWPLASDLAPARTKKCGCEARLAGLESSKVSMNITSSKVPIFLMAPWCPRHVWRGIIHVPVRNELGFLHFPIYPSPPPKKKSHTPYENHH